MENANSGDYENFVFLEYDEEKIHFPERWKCIETTLRMRFEFFGFELSDPQNPIRRAMMVHVTQQKCNRVRYEVNGGNVSLEFVWYGCAPLYMVDAVRNNVYNDESWYNRGISVAKTCFATTYTLRLRELQKLSNKWKACEMRWGNITAKCGKDGVITISGVEIYRGHESCEVVERWLGA